MVALAAVAVLVAVGVRALAPTHAPNLPGAADYAGVAQFGPTPDVPVRAGGSAGQFQIRCGRNENGHRNADNLIRSPRMPGMAMHLHDYVGNTSTTAMSTRASLAAASTTCADHDRSSYYWPVLRLIGPGSGPASAPTGSNTGQIVDVESVLVQYRGNPASKVVAMPDFLYAVTGTAKAITEGGANTEHVQWGCSGVPGRSTKLYPLCPLGQKVTRIFDLPSCWDGRRTDSPDHRAHLLYPDAAGVCPAATFAVAQLRVTLTYSPPPGYEFAVNTFAIDTMAAERRSSYTDHFDLIEVMPARLRQDIATCLNSGRHC
jgi:hypothetical protein